MAKSEKNTVIKSNILLEKRKSFTLLEMKLLLSVISQIKREDEDFRRYRIQFTEFQELINMKGKGYAHIRKVANDLKNKNIEIEYEPGKHHFTSYFSDVFTGMDQSYIDFYVSPLFKPYLLQLKANFTIYDIRNIMRCKSVHSIRIYQLLKQYESIGKRIITLEDLKFILGLEPDQYPRWNNFKARILEIARKELKQHSDIFFEYETKRQGRLIHSITFIIKKQKQQRLFDGKPEPSVKDAKPVTSYQVDATGKAIEEQKRLLDAKVVPLSKSGLKR